jgi:hypothetical protein
MPSELRKVILAVRTTGIHRSTAWTASSAVNMTRSALTLHLAFLPLRADLSIREAVELLPGSLNGLCRYLGASNWPLRWGIKDMG